MAILPSVLNFQGLVHFYRMLWVLAAFEKSTSTSNMSLLRSRRKMFTLVWLGQYWSVKKEPSVNHTTAEQWPETFSCFLWSLMKKKAGTLTNVLEGLVLKRHKKCSSATNSMVLISFCQVFSLFGYKKRSWGVSQLTVPLNMRKSYVLIMCLFFSCSPLYL